LSLATPLDGTHPALLCLYARHLAPGETTLASLGPQPCLAGLGENTAVLQASDAATALQLALLAHPGRPVVLLDLDAGLPPFAALRLLRLPRSEKLLGVLDARDLDALDSAAGDLDRLCWLIGEPQPLPHDRVDARACRIPARRIAEYQALLAAGTNQTLPADCEAELYTRLCLPASSEHATEPDREPADPVRPAEVLAGLRARLAALCAEPAAPGYPGLDGKPVLLHALHGWGGGSERFVADLIQADTQAHHLLLQAVSAPDQKRPGSAVALRLRPGASALRLHPLAAPIAATAISSTELAECVDDICADFGVGGVLVSSLIGLSLDLLRTGLPTAVVCHDYHPLWPSLHADFGAPEFEVSEAALHACLAEQGAAYPFGERRPQAWLALRDAYVAALCSARAALIAPTRAVLSNVVRLAPALAELPQHCIAHGVPPWPAPLPQPAPRAQRDTLRVLVPGRINGGKGEHLLAQLIPQLPPGVELVLLGCGAAGMRFFGADRVHVELDYARDELPRRVAELDPDLALLPASVAETFSYTLSELRLLGLPVLATRIGSYAERIQHGRDGLLVEPEAAAIARALQFLARSPQALRSLVKAPVPVQTLASMALAYAEVIGVQVRSALARPGTGSLSAVQCLAYTAALADARIVQQQLKAQSQRWEATAGERAQWARDQEKLAQERTTWAESLDVQMEMLRDRLEVQHGQIDGLKHSIEQARQSVDDAVGKIAAVLRAAGESPDALPENAEFDAVLTVLDGRLQALDEESRRLNSLVAALEQQRDHFESERNRILHSSSWKLTRPLRGIRRLLERGLASLGFRRQRAGSLLGRGLRSLRTRGVSGTLQRIRQEVRPELPQTVLDVPASAPFAPFALPCPESPRVSVVIPVYNHLDHSLTCLRSIAAHPSSIAAEIIVVDDCSSDDTAETLPQIEGLRYLRNPENLGFIGACNAGASAARGEYLVFLNNDTAVQPGWLDALIETFETEARVGLVGAKLIYPDGRLQEAGGIVFNDASGWNYGRFGDPAAPEFNYLREVDYCSGAAIAIRADLFAEFGGFDRHYAPAYYEDTDLAMKVRAQGLRVLYQPKSAVVHFEGVSSGTDTSTGIKAYQVVNQQKFLERWSEQLKSHPTPGTPIALARQHRDARRVLIIDATTPTPDQDSGSLRMVNLMRVLRAEGVAVTFFADNRAFVERYTEELQQLGVEVLWHPFLADVPGWFAEHGRRFDLVVLSRHYIAIQYVDLVRLHAPQARLVFDTVDLHYLREQREAELADRDDLRRQAAQTRDRELDLIRRSDITLVVSPVEQALLASEASGARVDILSNVHEVFGCRKPFEQRHDIVFMGGYQHTPNVDAVMWFADEVLSLIRAEAPEITFHVVGSKAPETVRALGERPGIMFQGFVPDIAPFMDNCRLAVAPLRYGAGVKGKVNMSMSYGQPVVATPIAIEGMHAEPGHDVLVADSPEDFAAAVLQAYRDPDLWRQLSAGGLANVERHFGFESARQAVRSLFKH
jgi:GT2 family glycosyltransferase/glycosyltransferase involved in cell wall biosynthesis